MARSGVQAACLILPLLLLVLLSLVAGASADRKLLSAQDGHPAHDYASSVSIATSQAVLQRLVTRGGTAANVKEATELSMKNAQHSTKSWGLGYDDGLPSATGNKRAREGNDDNKR